MRYSHGLAAIFLLLSCPAPASDDASKEGTFLNKGTVPLLCIKDIETPQGSVLCTTTVKPGAACRADAIGEGEGKPVYKIPNYTNFNCYGMINGRPDCRPKDAYNDGAFLTVAKAKWKIERYRHSEKRVLPEQGYEGMDWSSFTSLMTGSMPADPIKVIACKEDWTPVPPGKCYRENTEYFHTVYRTVRDVSEAL